MMRHVSLFRLKPGCRTPEIVAQLERQLRELPQVIPTITDCEVGVKPFAMPAQSPDGAVQFYDLIQIVTFATEEDCMAYPASQGHNEFLTASAPYMEQVVGIDYPI